MGRNKKLKYVEDDSNDDIKFDRNYLRKEVLTKISESFFRFLAFVGAKPICLIVFSI